MPSAQLPLCPICPMSPIPRLRTVQITDEWEPRLQRFFEENPQYFFEVHGQPASPSAARETIQGEPPPGWSFAKKQVIGYVEADGSMAAVADVITDLLAPGVWHLGLFIVATARHGSGDAQAIMRGLESWAMENGARWLRLGVVKGNARAERFWESLGFQDARIREGVEIGRRKHSMRVMFKPLTGSTREQYLSLIDRDRPDDA